MIPSHPALDRLGDALDRAAGPILPTLARLVFAAVLLVYYVNAGLAKLGEGALGFLRPELGAYAAIFPRAMEAVSYDVSQLGLWHWLVTVSGTWAEILLPLLILAGLFTRLAALGMIGVVVIQSATDVLGHGVGGADLGRFFDIASGAVILDQRALWIFVLLVLVMKGGGPLALDRVAFRNAPSARPVSRPL